MEKIEIYCSHLKKERRDGNDCTIYSCLTCDSEWASVDHVPMVPIGFIRACDIKELVFPKNPLSTDEDR